MKIETPQKNWIQTFKNLLESNYFRQQISRVVATFGYAFMGFLTPENILPSYKIR